MRRLRRWYIPACRGRRRPVPACTGAGRPAPPAPACGPPLPPRRPAYTTSWLMRRDVSHIGLAVDTGDGGSCRRPPLGGRTRLVIIMQNCSANRWGPIDTLQYVVLGSRLVVIKRDCWALAEVCILIVNCPYIVFSACSHKYCHCIVTNKPLTNVVSLLCPQNQSSSIHVCSGVDMPPLPVLLRTSHPLVEQVRWQGLHDVTV